MLTQFVMIISMANMVLLPLLLFPSQMIVVEADDRSHQLAHRFPHQPPPPFKINHDDLADGESGGGGDFPSDRSYGHRDMKDEDEGGDGEGEGDDFVFPQGLEQKLDGVSVAIPKSNDDGGDGQPPAKEPKTPTTTGANKTRSGWIPKWLLTWVAQDARRWNICDDHDTESMCFKDMMGK